MTYVRIFKHNEGKEVLINVDRVSRIDVKYVVGGRTNYWRTSLEEVANDPEAVRMFEIHCAGEVIHLLSNPDDPVGKVFEDIYNNSVKGLAPQPQDPSGEDN